MLFLTLVDPVLPQKCPQNRPIRFFVWINYLYKMNIPGRIGHLWHFWPLNDHHCAPKWVKFLILGNVCHRKYGTCAIFQHLILIEKGAVTGRPSLPSFCPIGAQKGPKSVVRVLFSKNGWLCGFKYILVTPDPIQQLVVSFSQMSWIYMIS